MRPSRRAPDELRAVTLERGVVKYAEGSCLVKFGDTHVLVTATLEDRLPPWLKGQGRGWVTAEYGMLPRATLERTRREASAGKQNGRTIEIQRLIGRSLRTIVDLEALGERQITVDCDVLQADGGTRTASITGAWVALADCIAWMRSRNMIKEGVLRDNVAVTSTWVSPNFTRQEPSAYLTTPRSRLTARCSSGARRLGRMGILRKSGKNRQRLWLAQLVGGGRRGGKPPWPDLPLVRGTR